MEREADKWKGRELEWKGKGRESDGKDKGMKWNGNGREGRGEREKSKGRRSTSEVSPHLSPTSLERDGKRLPKAEPRLYPEDSSQGSDSQESMTKKKKIG